MKYIGFDREADALAWAKEVLGIEHQTGFARVVSATDDAGNFVFAVVLSNFVPRNVDMHIAATDGAQWATPHEGVRMFNDIFNYVFRQLGAARVTGLVRNKNDRAKQFVEHLGFTREGVMREVFENDDLCIYGFLKGNFEAHKWYRS